MKGSSERQALEEALRDEKVGSAKIQALGDYDNLKDIEWRTEHRPAEMDEFDSMQLIIEKAVLEQHMRLRKFYADAYEYMEAFERAEATLKPYLEIASPYIYPYQVFLDDLREINREKSQKIRTG